MIKSKNRPNTAYSNNDGRYWKDHLFKRTTDDWYVQVAFAGRRERFPLGTPNRDAAAVKARAVYQSLHGAGWEQTVAKFKPWTVKAVMPSGYPTVGEFLAEMVGTRSPSGLNWADGTWR